MESVVDLRYEDLVQDRLGRVSELYQRLDLGDFEPIRDKLVAFIAAQKDYQANEHQLEPGLKSEIRSRWSGYFEKYGYE